MSSRAAPWGVGAALCALVAAGLLPACEGVPVCVPGLNCPLISQSQLAVGGVHACWIHPDGTLWCWGDNGAGETALFDDPGESYPIQVGSSAGWSHVAAGYDHTCAITGAGALWCWGDNNDGESAPSVGEEAAVAPHLVDQDVWSTVVGGTFFTCGLHGDRTLWCWGDDGLEQSGGYGRSYQGPVPIEPGQTWRALAVGDFHACAVRSDGTLWCWGDDDRGQLGDTAADVLATTQAGARPLSKAPLQVGAAANWWAIGAGQSHTCGLRSDGTLWCWGANDHGQLGVAASLASRPVQVPPIAGGSWEAVAAGGDSTCALASNRTLWCWGANGEGQLGLGTRIDAPAPAQVGADADWQEISVGEMSACGMHASGAVACWGFDGLGQVGDGDPQAKTAPLPLAPGTWRMVSSGDAATCGIQTDGSLWCAGFLSLVYDGYPYLNTISTSPVFAPIGTSHDWTAVSAGDSHACAVQSDGSLWCWGTNLYGELGTGDGIGSDVPREVAPSGWLGPGGLAAGDLTTCALQQDRSLWCWGSDEFQQLGTGNGSAESLPTEVDAGPWTQICGMYATFCGIRLDGTLWCWGSDRFGQADVPTQLGNGADWKEVACGGAPAALRQDGTVEEIGAFTSPPTALAGAPLSVSISSGEDQICGVTAAGRLWCDLGNDDGDVGNGQMTATTFPAQVGTDADWASVWAGEDSCTLALKKDGALWGWGSNESAQLGLAGDLKTTPFTLPAAEAPP